MKPIAMLERHLSALYRDGHTTGYGAGRPVHDRWKCEGCQEARSISHELDAIWREWERQRLSTPASTLTESESRLMDGNR